MNSRFETRVEAAAEWLMADDSAYEHNREAAIRAAREMLTIGDQIESETAVSEFRWIEHDPAHHSLMLGRIDLAQLSQGTSGHWFYHLKFTDGERQSYSCATKVDAVAVCEAHGRKVIAS
jgi:hypothetical protein